MVSEEPEITEGDSHLRGQRGETGEPRNPVSPKPARLRPGGSFPTALGCDEYQSTR